MRDRRRLTLRREVLTELNAEDLTRVAGAGDVGTLPLGYCLSDKIANCDSNLRPCISHTCTR